MVKKIIIEVDRQQYEAKYIGKGKYSKAYQVGDRIVLYTRGDCAKEVLAMFQYDRMAHLPEIIRHDNVQMRSTTVLNQQNIWYVFSSPYYRNVTKKDKSAYELMNKLIKEYQVFWRMINTNKSDIYVMQMFVDSLDHPRTIMFPRSVVRALQELVNVSSNCGGQPGFDFKKNNFGVNEYGTLIFRDLVFVIN